MPKIKDRIKELREEAGLTQQELGERIGVSQKSIGGYETGGATPPTDIVIKLADVFNTTTEYLLCRTDFRKSLPILYGTFIDDSALSCGDILNRVFHLEQPQRKILDEILSLIVADDSDIEKLFTSYKELTNEQRLYLIGYMQRMHEEDSGQ